MSGTKKLGDICFPTGEYQDRQSGETKKRWMRCGVLLQNAQGEYRVKLDALPLNPGDGWFAVFAPKDNQSSQSSTQQGFRDRPAAPETDDDIPF